MIAATIFLVALFSPAARAQEPAELAPIDSGGYVQIDNLAKHFELMQDEPLLVYIQQKMEWDQFEKLTLLLNKLEMTREQLFETYFGENVVIFGQSLQGGMMVPIEVDDGEGGKKIEMKEMTSDQWNQHYQQLDDEQRQKIFNPENPDHRFGQAPPRAVLFTEAPAEQIADAIEKLALEKLDHIGDFDLYRSQEDELLYAVNDRWFGFAQVSLEAYLRQVLGQVGGEQTLAHSEEYHNWLDQLPANRIATLFIRPTGGGEAHIMGLTHAKRNTTFHYVGFSRMLDQFIGVLSDSQTLNFGPLPSQTVAAYAVNTTLGKMTGPGPGGPFMMRQLDQFFTPKSFEKDIMPKLAAPTVFFAGEVPREQFDADPGFDVPVAGVALKLKDRAVAEDIDKAGDNIVNLINLAAVASGAEAMEVQQIQHAGATLRVIDVGPYLATQRPGWRHAVQLTFGRIGDWYMICSNAMFFKHGVLARPGDFGSVKRSDQDDMQPMFRVYVAPEKLAGMFKHWSKSKELQTTFTFDLETAKNFGELGDMARHYESLDARFYRRDDDLVVGRVNLVRQREK